MFGSSGEVILKLNQHLLTLFAILLTWGLPSFGVTSGTSYELTSTCDTTKALTISYDSPNDGALAVLGTQSDTRVGEIFKIELAGSPYYRLINKGSLKVLAISAASKVSGASVIQTTSTGASSQLFTLEYPSTGIYKFRNANSSMYLELAGANTAVGTKFQQGVGTTSCAQRFKLKDMTALSASLITDHVFASTSPWYTPIPATAALNTNSANMLKDFQNQKLPTFYNGTVNINTRSYSSPVFVAPAGAATVKVTEWDCQNKGYSNSTLATQWAAVPIPSTAKPSSGTDGEMTIYQPSTNTIWEFWKTVHNADGSWKACWGGRMQSAASNPGYYVSPWGTTATSLTFLGGQITAAELKRGEIRHAIGIALRNATVRTTFSWPAQRADGNGKGIIPQGTRIRLDPTVNVDSLGIHPMAKVIAKAAQKYGFIVWDTAGSVSIRAQNVVSYTAIGQIDPYHTDANHTGLFGTTPDYDVLKGFPWDRLQFMPNNYGKP